jgi:4-amino-4-deoxy-L-arabinose transferase-like glycosyltransferase
MSHRLLHSLQHLSLHHQYLLKGWWWWWLVGIVLIVVVVAVASVRHLVIMEGFEKEIEIKIKNFQLYASRYNDD